MSPIPKAIKELQAGKFIIVTDDISRENEGDLIMAAEFVTPESLGFMIRHTSGIICQPLEKERLQELHLPQMVAMNTDPKQTAFTVSVDYHFGVTTGISSQDRCKTILSLIHPDTKPHYLRRPGHIFPLQSKEGGVLKRAGHTEAGMDLMKIGNLYPSCVISELVNDDGSVAKFKEITQFADQHNLVIISVDDIIKYRRRTEKLVECVGSAKMPTDYGDFVAYVYESQIDGVQHIALVKGDVKDRQNVLVRVHSECLTGDVFGSKRCDCGIQLNQAMKKIEEAEAGVIIYLRGHEGRGIGLGHKLRAYHLQDNGRDTVEANVELGLPIDSREYGIGAQMLADLGITTISLMTNNPSKYTGLSGYGLKITERIPLISPITFENCRYMETKKLKLGHLL